MAASKKRVTANDHPVEASDLKSLFLLSDYVSRMSPWEYLHEGQVFGVRALGGNGEIYWVSVIGGGGEVFAVNVYRGARGLAGLTILMGALVAEEEDGVEYDPVGVGMEQCMYQLEFVPKGELDSWDRKAIKKAGRSLPTKRNGMTAKFVSQLPGYLPWRLDSEEGREFSEVLNWVATGLSFLEEEPEVCPNFPSKEILVLEFGEGGNCDIVWEALKPLISASDEEVRPLLELDEFSREKYLRLPRESDLEWELASSIAPGPVREKNCRPFFPHVALVCERERGLVLTTEAYEGDQRNSAILKVLLQSLDTLGRRPESVIVDERGLYQMIEPWFAKIDVNVKFAPCSSCDEAFESMFDFFEGAP